MNMTEPIKQSSGVKRTALITGITGQDGILLGQNLLERGYRVVGFGRRESIIMRVDLRDLLERIELSFGDMSDPFDIADVIQHVQPDEIYNLASQSDVSSSWARAIETGDVTGLGAHRIFEAVRRFSPGSRVYHASSSEMFGEVRESPQNESTPFCPTSPYGAAKVYAHQLAAIYRRSFGLYVSCGILFNHESPYRGRRFLTQKVAHGAACAALGIQDSPELNEQGEPMVREGKLTLGNLGARRDWGAARDYVGAMWAMLQLDQGDDFVVGTGMLRTVEELCETAYRHVGVDWARHVRTDERFLRPWETTATVADATKARRVLGWSPRTDFKEMLGEMVDAQINRLRGSDGIAPIRVRPLQIPSSNIRT
jgi:GDPmannose 4,6-dehydratase